MCETNPSETSVFPARELRWWQMAFPFLEHLLLPGNFLKMPSGPLEAPSGRFHFSWPLFWRWNWKCAGSLRATASWPGDRLNWKSNHSHAYVPAFVAHTLLAVLLLKAPGSLTTHGSVDPPEPYVFSPSIEQSVPFAMNNLCPWSNPPPSIMR